MLTQPTPTFIASGGTIPAGARVRAVNGDPTKVVLAGLTEPEIGTAILHSGKTAYAVDTGVGVKLRDEPGGRHFIAAGAIAIGANLKRAANGKVASDGNGTDLGFIAMEAAGADGDIIEGIPQEAAPAVVAVTSANGALAGAADLAALKVESEKLGDDFRALHAALVAKGLVAAS